MRMAPLQSEQRKGEMGEHDVGVDRLVVYSQKDGRVRMHARGVAAVGNASSPSAALRGWLRRED